MMNYFTIFDPMSGLKYIHLNWLFMAIPIFTFYSPYWTLLTRSNWFKMLIFNFFNKEFDLILKNKISKIMFSALVWVIMTINFLGLFSFIFTSTSHMSLNLSLALPFWLSFMLMGWLFKTNDMLSHMLPKGTPIPLMPFMVLIEFISNIIRPLTLSIRLTANMIAGHLLLTLLSSAANNAIFPISIITILIQVILMILEMAVAFIQAHVFVILLSLYSQES